MGKASKDKGARGEREAAAALSRITRTPWERSLVQVRRGGAEAPDIRPEVRGTSLDELHVEVKIGARPSLWGALEQAARDAEARGRVPMVVARRDRGQWVALVLLDDLPTVGEWLRGGA